MIGSNYAWNHLIDDWKRRFQAKTFHPAHKESVERVDADLLPKSVDIRGLYAVSNGISLDRFEILPIEENERIKSTWNGVRLANTVGKTKALGGDPELLERFFVFARIGSGDHAVIDRLSGRIWYEEGGELIETSFSLPEFIEAGLREVRDQG